MDHSSSTLTILKSQASVVNLASQKTATPQSQWSAATALMSLDSTYPPICSAKLRAMVQSHSAQESTSTLLEVVPLMETTSSMESSAEEAHLDHSQLYLMEPISDWEIANSLRKFATVTPMSLPLKLDAGTLELHLEVENDISWKLGDVPAQMHQNPLWVWMTCQK